MLPTNFRYIWPNGFRGEESEKSANQKQESPVVAMFVNGSGRNEHSSVNGRFRVEMTEVRRVHMHSSLLVLTSNQNASNNFFFFLNIYPKPGMSHYIPCLIAEYQIYYRFNHWFFFKYRPQPY